MNAGICSLDINIRLIGGEKAELALDGFVDADTAGVLDRRLHELRESGVNDIVIDCTGISYLSSHGVAVLVQNRLDLQAAHGRITLCGMDDRVRMIFDYLHLGDVFTMLDGSVKKTAGVTSD